MKPLVIIENNAEGGMVATQLHYDIEYPNVFAQGHRNGRYRCNDEQKD